MWRVRRAVVVGGLVASLLFATSGAPGFVVYAQRTAHDPAAQRDLLERLFDALAEEHASLDRSTFDPLAALDATDGTPAGAFAWVRDEIGFVPYHGALRGSVGVLMDGTGNALDRALLLQDMVQLLGYEARLARAQLADPVAERLLTEAVRVSPRAQRTQDPTAAWDVDLAGIAERSGVDAADLSEALDAGRSSSAALLGGLAERVGTQTAFLAGAVAGARGGDEAARARARDALADHWWVEYHDAGAWIALDPSMPTATPGEALAAADEVVDAWTLDELPPDLVHTMRLRVVVECVVDGALQENVLVETGDLIAADLVGIRLSVAHVPSALTGSSDLDPAAFREAVLAQDRWFPTISLGGESLYDLGFTAACEVGPATPPWLGGAVAGAADAAADVFGALPANETVSALFLEYVVAAPGAGTTTERRAVFDLLGASARATAAPSLTTDDDARLAWRLALLGETEVLATTGRWSDAFVADLLARGLEQQRGVIVEVPVAIDQAAEDPTAVTSLTEQASEGAPLPSALIGLALARQVGMPPEVYQDRIDVVNRHSQLGLDADGAIVRRQAFDFVRNDVAVLPSVPDARRLRIEQGVRDTNAETLLATVLCDQVATDSFCRTAPNPGDLLAGAPDRDGWLVATSEADLAPLRATWSDEALASMTADLGSGAVVVAPLNAPTPSSGERTWWRVDPTTGATLGVGERGWGVSTAEYAFILNVVSFAFCEVSAVRGGAAVGGTLMCTFGFVTGTGGILAVGTASTVSGVAGVLMLASVILYGIGGLGIPAD